jgi:MFS family permease
MVPMRLSCPTLGRDVCLEIRRVDDRDGASIAALLVPRLANGVFIGGEYTAAYPLAMEYSHKARRGLNAALIHMGYRAALVCVSLLTASILSLITYSDCRWQTASCVRGTAHRRQRTHAPSDSKDGNSA